MNTMLISLVAEAFSDVAGQFGLRFCESSPEEVSLVGSGYAILIWNDRDGISLHYLDLGGPVNQGTVNLGAYLATKRRWVVDQQMPRAKDYWSTIRNGLHNSARTLSEMAPDILRGEKAWLTETSVEYDPLSETHREKLLQDFAQCLSNAATGSTDDSPGL